MLVVILWMGCTQPEVAEQSSTLAETIEKVFPYMVSDLLQNNEKFTPPPPSLFENSAQNRDEAENKSSADNYEVRVQEWREDRKKRFEKRAGKQHVLFSNSEISIPMYKNDRIVEYLRQCDYRQTHFIEVLEEDFPDISIKDDILLNLRFNNRVTMVLRSAKPVHPRLNLELSKIGVLPLGFLQINRGQLSQDKKRVLISGYFKKHFNIVHFTYIFKHNNEGWNLEIACIVPVH